MSTQIAVKRLVDLSRFQLPPQYRNVIENPSIQEELRRRFSLPPYVRVVKVTVSVCPICRQRIPTVVYEEDGAIWLLKKCPEHGVFRDLYWGDAELYYYFIQWDTQERIGEGLSNPYVTYDEYLRKGGCPYVCGLCPMHRTNTILAIIDVTNRCNMRCPVCFAYAAAVGYVYEPSLEQIEFMLRSLRSQRPWAPNAIQFSGGEPTLRNDLPEIVRMAKELGFDHVEVNTNGIRLAFDVGYYKKLLDSGMSTIYLQCDTVNPNNEGIRRHRAYDPRAYVEIRKRVIENARAIGHKSVVLVVTVARNYNEKDLGKIIDFAIENRDVVRWINIQPVAFAGRAREYSPEEIRSFRITIPDVIIEIERQTNGRIGRWDWRPVNWPVALVRLIEALTNSPKPLFTNNPVCGASTLLYYDEDEGQYVPVTKLVDVDSFERTCLELYKKASRGGLWKGVAGVELLKLLKYVRHKAFRDLLGEVLLRRDYESLGKLMFNLVGIGIMHFMDYFNYDLQRVQRCSIHYVAPNGMVLPFCTMNNFHREKIERRFSVPVDVWLKMKGARDTSCYA